MNWKDLLLIFLVVLAAIVTHEQGIKPLLSKKSESEKAE